MDTLKPCSSNDVTIFLSCKHQLRWHGPKALKVKPMGSWLCIAKRQETQCSRSWSNTFCKRAMAGYTEDWFLESEPKDWTLISNSEETRTEGRCFDASLDLWQIKQDSEDGWQAFDDANGQGTWWWNKHSEWQTWWLLWLHSRYGRRCTDLETPHLLSLTT